MFEKCCHEYNIYRDFQKKKTAFWVVLSTLLPLTINYILGDRRFDDQYVS